MAPTGRAAGRTGGGQEVTRWPPRAALVSLAETSPTGATPDLVPIAASPYWGMDTVGWGWTPGGRDTKARFIYQHIPIWIHQYGQEYASQGLGTAVCVTWQLMMSKRSVGGSLVRSSVVSSRETSPRRQHWDFTSATYHSWEKEKKHRKYVSLMICRIQRQWKKKTIPHLICRDELGGRWRIPIQGVCGHRRCGAAGANNRGSEPVQQGVEPLMPALKNEMDRSYRFK